MKIAACFMLVSFSVQQSSDIDADFVSVSFELLVADKSHKIGKERSVMLTSVQLYQLPNGSSKEQ
uniref:Uncharacterized protein n=1 Tax=Salix viminalis TaxID=40686 RepID=A0A6N2MTN7_SALVM